MAGIGNRAATSSIMISALVGLMSAFLFFNFPNSKIIWIDVNVYVFERRLVQVDPDHPKRAKAIRERIAQF